VAVEDQLAWEARRRPRAGLAAILGAALTLGASILNGTLFTDRPVVGVLDSLDRAAQPGPVERLESLRVPFYEFVQDRLVGVVAASVAQALAFLSIGWALTFLAAATKARRPEMPRLATYLGLFGGGLLAFAGLLSTLGTALAVDRFLSGSRTVAAADDIARDSLVLTSQFILLPGTLALALAFVLVALNAMRAGLLTRFMGILGVIVGVLIVLPIGTGLPVVQIFWLLATGLMLLGRWPGGLLPAWRTGRAEPWPTQQELREARERDAERAEEPAGRERGSDPEPAAVAAGSEGAADGRRRKRKRRG